MNYFVNSGKIPKKFEDEVHINNIPSSQKSSEEGHTSKFNFLSSIFT